MDGGYAAFPSVCRSAGGQLRLVWRQGSDHVNARDGRIHTTTSTDNGRTWSTATVAVTDVAGVDLRDPCISTAGGTTWLTYFKGTSSLAAAGCFLRISTNDGATWGSEIRIDSLPYAAISAPVVQVGANLLATFYGKASGDTFDSSWLATSTNGGTTWTTTRVANGQADGRHYQEPWLVARGTEVWMFFRYGTQSAIGSSVSTNSGTSWSAPAQLFDDASGRPAAAWLSTGTMAVVARRISDKQAIVRSRNSATAQTAWLPPRPTMVQPSSGPIGMMYAHPLEVPGGVICPLGIETSTSVSRIHVGWLADDGGVSPLGDLIPDDRTAAATNVDQLLFAEGFSQANGPLRAPWVVGAGGIQASNGYAVSTAVDNVPDLAWVDLANSDTEIEADFWYTGQAGFGIIARVAGANTYLLLTLETGGTALRLYQVVSGSTSLLTAATNTTARASAWARLRMFVRGNTIQCYLNGWPLLGWELSAADAIPFAGQTRHGIKLNPASPGVHQCRRFVAWS
ncbi:exo-alpha-sialidase [Actinophytocola oryzae]|uniref:exo-alpha-sialidase n=1 Tax=Actinophytocola oryzae TaxID=502181 RepID=UPI0014152AF7|nr:exo-alpha-sialidase [Actinophytocola oryzae]